MFAIKNKEMRRRTCIQNAMVHGKSVGTIAATEIQQTRRRNATKVMEGRSPGITRNKVPFGRKRSKIRDTNQRSPRSLTDKLWLNNKMGGPWPVFINDTWP